MTGVETEGTAERYRWQSKRSQMMRGGEALWRRRQPDHVLQGKHKVLSRGFRNLNQHDSTGLELVLRITPGQASCLDLSLSLAHYLNYLALLGEAHGCPLLAG